jgi:DNA-binding NarL/FixJ family response regulator
VSAPAAGSLRVLLVDDHAFVRQGVRHALGAGLGDVEFGEAATPDDALALVRRERWDLVVLDIALPGRGGLETLRQLKRERPALPIVMLSMHSEDQYAVRALRDGAAGYVTKDSDPEVLVEAARTALAGRTFVSARAAEVLARAVRGDARELHETLSDRELEVLRGIALGKSLKEIAFDLALSEKTVATYRARLLEKMHMTSAAELIQYAVRHGLVE